MVAQRPNRTPSLPWIIGCIVCVGVFAAVLLQDNDDKLSRDTLSDAGGVTPASSAPASSPVVAEDIEGDSGQDQRSSETGLGSDTGPVARFTTTIHRPSGPPTIDLQHPDPQGRLGSIACSTCHSVRKADFTHRSPADLEQFHQNMPMNHGSLSCYSCHNPEDADTLRLADTTVVSYPDVMTLCAQCHGTQARDYEHGAHGGMNGYWDLRRGPRTRNNCIDCHDPHVPKFPSMKPTFKPRDRFLHPAREANHE